MATTITFTVAGECNYAVVGGRGVYGKTQTFSFTKQELQDNADLRKTLVEAMQAGILTAKIGDTSINAAALENIDESTEELDIGGVVTQIENVEEDVAELQGNVSSLQENVADLLGLVTSGTGTVDNAATYAVSFDPALQYNYTPVAYTGSGTIYVTHISNVSGNGFTIHFSEAYTGTVYWTIIKRS